MSKWMLPHLKDSAQILNPSQKASSLYPLNSHSAILYMYLPLCTILITCLIFHLHFNPLIDFKLLLNWIYRCFILLSPTLRSFNKYSLNYLIYKIENLKNSGVRYVKEGNLPTFGWYYAFVNLKRGIDFSNPKIIVINLKLIQNLLQSHYFYFVCD